MSVWFKSELRSTELLVSVILLEHLSKLDAAPSTYPSRILHATKQVAVMVYSMSVYCATSLDEMTVQESPHRSKSLVRSSILDPSLKTTAQKN
ncbi:hypothetical protein F5146DRAFT_183587 [Armillaria mellea]|nr:hypothetical protein F5146DRAFT_183587 [Armillaria mellea]